MENERIAVLLARKLAGEITSAELQELQELLASYPDMLYYDETLEQLWQRDENNGLDIAAAYSRHRLKYADEFYSEKSQGGIVKSLFKKDNRIRKALAAASVLLPLLIGVFIYLNYFNTALPSSTLEITAGKGIRKSVVLPDGTKVWLNAGSRLIYDADMKSEAQRLVFLTGEAYFDVAHDKLHPFIIKTEKFSIKVLGTAFNVKAYPGESNSEAALIRGMIELTLNDRPEQKIVLKPKEKFALSEKQPAEVQKKERAPLIERKVVIENIRPVEVSNQKYVEEISWVDNKLVFENESFEELVPKLERWYNVKLRIRNKAVYDYHFTGAFENESIEQALKAMQLIRSFNFKLTNNDVIEIY